MEEVIERAKGGDADALAQMWRTYQHLLLRYFRAKGMADADDLASIVWVEVATGLHRFEGSEHDFRRWLFTIAARRRIDDIRSIQRRQRDTERHQPREEDLVAPSASEEGDRAFALDRAIALVAALPPDQREAVTLRVIGDLSVSDVAAIMGRREGTVRVLVHRGLKRLADHADVTDQPARTMSSS
jgi:RNA polymerase sigma-70 factor (ECF subfamily)